MDTIIMNKDALDTLPEDLRFILMQHLETRFWKRSCDYQYREMTPLLSVARAHAPQVPHEMALLQELGDAGLGQ